MGETTGISWCDHTFNSWWGCEKRSAGCQNCYAETLAKRFGWGRVFSSNKQRRFFGQKHWNEPIVWNEKAKANGKRESVFCLSMGDVFDDPSGDYELACQLNGFRDDLWRLILKTPYLDWLLLTKCPENIDGLIYHEWHNPEKIPANVRIGITCENQEMADKRIPVLLNSWTGKNFISVEPMLSSVDIFKAVGLPNRIAPHFSWSQGKGIDWVICGCESGSNARPCNIEWIRDLRDQCIESGTAFFLKQMEVDGKLVKEPFLDGRQWLEFTKGSK